MIQDAERTDAVEDAAAAVEATDPRTGAWAT